MAKGVVFGGLNGGGGSNVKSVQRGTLVMTAITQNITISDVDLNNSIVKIHSLGNTGVPRDMVVMGKLTSATNVEVSRYAAGGNVNIAWEVIEFTGVKSLQKGEAIHTGIAVKSVTLSPVDLTKTFIMASFKNDYGAQATSAGMAKIAFINSTTISLENNNDSAKTYYWYVIEFN